MVFVTPGEELAGLHHVRYDGVPLLDRPDDVLGRLMQELDGGDEVNVLECAEIWTQVRTPDNLVGWVPSMTLVAVSASPAEDVPEPPVAIDLDLPAVGGGTDRAGGAVRSDRGTADGTPGAAACGRSDADAATPAVANAQGGGAADADADSPTPPRSEGDPRRGNLRSRCDQRALAKVIRPGADPGLRAPAS